MRPDASCLLFAALFPVTEKMVRFSCHHSGKRLPDRGVTARLYGGILRRGRSDTEHLRCHASVFYPQNSAREAAMREVAAN